MNPERVVLLVTVRANFPWEVFEFVITVRVEVPEPLGIVNGLRVAVIPAAKVAEGTASSSLTRLLKLAFGVIRTVTT